MSSLSLAFRRFPIRLSTWTTLLLLSTGCGNAPGTGDAPSAGSSPTLASDTPPPIVVISIDTLRSDRLPIYGYTGVETPAIDALRQDAILFERAYAHYPLTFPSHVALFTGQLPPQNGVRDNAGYRLVEGYAPWLPRLLRDAGYATAGMVSSYVLRADTGFAQGFETYNDETPAGRADALQAAERAGDDTLVVARAWLRQAAAQASTNPPFLFFHIYEPHLPFTPPEPFATRWGHTYEGEIATADAIIGDLLDSLRELGLYDDALVVLLSDHGEGLMDHGEESHGILLYRELIQVPLVVKLPGAERAGESVSTPVQLVDLAPTVADLTGLELPGDLPGTSLLEIAEGAEPERGLYAETWYPRLHFGWNELASLIDGRWHYILAPEPELYDLVADPAETQNVLRENPNVYRDLRDHLATLHLPLEPPSEREDPETVEKLRALGYLSTDAGSLDDGPLPDPKVELLRLAGRLEEAMTFFDTGDFESAAPMLRALVDENPAMTDIWESLGTAYFELGRHEDALAAYERVLELTGGAPQASFQVGRALTRLGRLDEALQHAEVARRFEMRLATDLEREIALELADAGRPAEAIAVLQPLVADRGDAPTLNAMARVLLGAGRAAAAAPLVERVLAEDPENALAWEHRGLLALQAGQPAAARQALQRSIDLADNHANAWNLLAVARYQLGDSGGALDAWQRAVELDPRHFDALYNLAMTAASAGRNALARRTLEQYIATAPPQRFGREIAAARSRLAQLGG